MNKTSVFATPLTDDQAAVFYLGQEGILILYHGKTICVDPYLTDYVDRFCCSEQVIWRRKYPSPITPEEFAFVDYVLCTHDHCDHTDPETLKRIADASPNTRFIAAKPTHERMLGYGVPADRLIDAIADIPMTLDCFTVTPVPAAHEELHKDAEGNYAELGYVIAFGDMKVYHAGDCCIYDGLEERVMNTDIAFLPINGRSIFKNRNDIIGNMTTEEAIDLACRTNAGMIVPLHFDLYDVNGVNPAIFVDMMGSYAPDLRYHIFRPGERYILCK